MEMNDSKDVSGAIRESVFRRKSPRLVRFELILTEACNLGCDYCFEYHADHKKSMSEETAIAAVRFAIESSRESKWIGFSFMGGEPMLQFALIKRIIDFTTKEAKLAGKTVAFDMQTNGVLIKEEHAEFFSKVPVRYCLSLDGAQLTHDQHRKTLGGSGSFQIVAAKMKMLKRHQHWQGARMTVMPDQASRLAENIRSLHEELAINQFVLGFATHVPWTDSQISDYAVGLTESFDYFLEQRVSKKSRRIRIGLFELGQLNQAYASSSSVWGCGAGSGRLAISPDGTYHGCSKLAWSAENGSAGAPLPLGDVETGISKPENRLLLLDHSATPRTKCDSCELKQHCTGGCHAANFSDSGNMYVPADYFCKLMFAQKYASDYARSRLDDLGIADLYWNSDIPDLFEMDNDSDNACQEGVLDETAC